MRRLHWALVLLPALVAGQSQDQERSSWGPWVQESNGVIASVSKLLLVATKDSSKPMLRLEANSSHFPSSFLEMEAKSSKSPLVFLRTISDGVVTFELSSEGVMHSQGLRMLSGGIQISSGGLQVEAGGIRVKGGLTISSGGLHLEKQQFSASSISASSCELALPLFKANAQSANFIGNVIQLEASSRGPFNFIHASQGTDEVFRVDSGGNLTMAGKAVMNGDLDLGGNLRLEGNIALSTATVQAGDLILIPSSAFFVEISDDKETRTNVLTLPPREEANSGQMMVILNRDAESTSGALKIPANSTIIIVFVNGEWRPVDALSAPSKVILSVTQLTLHAYYFNVMGIGAYGRLLFHRSK